MHHIDGILNSKNQWWRYAVTFVAAFFGGQFLGSIPIVIIMVIDFLKTGQFPVNPSNMASFGIEQNLGLVLMLLPFLLSMVILLVMVKPLHGRSFTTLINGLGKIRWKRFLLAAAIWIGLQAIYLLFDCSMDPLNYTWNFDAGRFAILVLISLVLITIQASFEELLFRGYLAQGVGALTKNRLLVILLPSLLFALMHAFNPEVEAYGFWLMMPQYLIISLAFGLISALDDGVELAMGGHVANNIFYSLMITHSASVFQTPALFVQKTFYPLRDLLVIIALVLLFMSLLAQIYKWNFRVLWTKIAVPHS